MAYRLKRRESVADGVRRIAGEQIDAGLRHVATTAASAAVQVHQLRTRCKKLRGLLRLVRSGGEEIFRREDAWFRETARRLSPLRDRNVVLMTYDQLVGEPETDIEAASLDAIRRKLERHRRSFEAVVDLEDELDLARRRLQQARVRISDWRWSGDEDELLCTGLTESYRRARKAMPSAMDLRSPDLFHRWRKSVKYHWYHLRLLRGAWPEFFAAIGNVARQMADDLGVDHDLWLLQADLYNESAPHESDTVMQPLYKRIHQRRRRCQQHSLQQGQRLFCESPTRFTRRCRRYWRIWRQ